MYIYYVCPGRPYNKQKLPYLIHSVILTFSMLIELRLPHTKENVLMRTLIVRMEISLQIGCLLLMLVIIKVALLLQMSTRGFDSFNQVERGYAFNASFNQRSYLIK